MCFLFHTFHLIQKIKPMKYMLYAVSITTFLFKSDDYNYGAMFDIITKKLNFQIYDIILKVLQSSPSHRKINLIE